MSRCITLPTRLFELFQVNVSADGFDTFLTVSDTANENMDFLLAEGQSDDYNAANDSPSNSNVNSEAFSAADSDKQKNEELSRSHPMGRNTAKRQRDAVAIENVNIMNVENIAKFFQHKADPEDEMNGIKMFSSWLCDSGQEGKGKAEYLHMIRRRYLRRVRDLEASEMNIGADGAARDCDAGNDCKIREWP